MNEDSPISLEDEKEITIEDILKNKNLYLKGGGGLKLFINNQFIINVEMSKEEPLK